MITQKLDMRLLNTLYTDARFELLFLALDTLHDAASEGRTHQVTALSKDELIGWLKEIAYTANETIRELEADRPLNRSVDGTADFSTAVHVNGELL